MQTYHRNVARRHFPTLLLQLRGVRPFLSDKYDITRHPNYKYLSDADPKNAFDIEKYITRKLKVKPDDTFEVFEVDLSNEEAAPT